jgi:hypothetical protein
MAMLCTGDYVIYVKGDGIARSALSCGWQATTDSGVVDLRWPTGGPLVDLPDCLMDLVACTHAYSGHHNLTIHLWSTLGHQLQTIPNAVCDLRALTHLLAWWTSYLLLPLKKCTLQPMPKHHLPISSYAMMLESTKYIIFKPAMAS